MNYREKIRKAIECPQFGNETYGEWGALRYEQRVLIKRLLDELDGADNLILILKKENQELKADYGTKAQVERDLLMEENQELKKQLEELESIVGLRQKRNLINKFNKEYEEDKKKNPNKSHAEIIPDAEEVYRRYYAMKTQQKKFMEYINSYIELLNDKPDLVELSQKDVLEEALLKYKEIIGNIYESEVEDE